MKDKLFKTLADFRLLIDSHIQALERDIDKLAEEKKQHEDAAYQMSAELTYKDRLIEEYETIVSKEQQESIKKFIFSEDDR